MHGLRNGGGRVARAVYRVTLVVVLIAGMLCAPPVAMAAKKKKEEAPATKSYVLPYFIVMMVVGVGLMTVCRPGSRKDKSDDKKKVNDD